MAKSRIINEIDGASDAAVARIANDTWARLNDPTRGVTLAVRVEGKLTLRRLNKDYEERYGAPGDWT